MLGPSKEAGRRRELPAFLYRPILELPSTPDLPTLPSAKRLGRRLN
jgi:hypothetical protein